MTFTTRGLAIKVGDVGRDPPGALEPKASDRADVLETASRSIEGRAVTPSVEDPAIPILAAMEKNMKSGNAFLKSTIVALSMCAGALYAPAAHAQVTYDVTKVTCEDYLDMPPQIAHGFSAWMSGWFNQKNNDTVVNFDGLAQNIENVRKWCGTNPKASVFDGLTRAAPNAKQGVGGPLDVDMSLITCKQFKGFDEDRRAVAQSWLSGYFNSTKNITKIDPRYVERNTKVVTKYCLSHMNDKLMAVIEKKAK